MAAGLTSAPPICPASRLAVTVHGIAETFPSRSEECAELRQAMLDQYLPMQGPSFEEWMDTVQALGARIVPEKLFTFDMGE